jgi:hypothetical protein
LGSSVEELADFLQRDVEDVRQKWAAEGVLCCMACGLGAMSRSEFLFWAMALAILVFSGIVVVVTSHNRHSHRGYITPSIIQYLASAS